MCVVDEYVVDVVFEDGGLAGCSIVNSRVSFYTHIQIARGGLISTNGAERHTRQWGSIYTQVSATDSASTHNGQQPSLPSREDVQ